MSFTSKNLQPKKDGMGFIKGATLFFLGMSCILFFARASFDITPNATNAIMYMAQIFLTQSGNNTSATGISLDGTVGNAFFNGKVGIGLSGPIYNLDVYKDTSSDVVKFKNNGGELYYGGSSGHGTGGNNLVLTTTSNSNTIQMYGATGGFGLEITQKNNRGGIPESNSITSRGRLSMGTITDAGVHLQTSMIDRLVINYTGDVGIGTDDPTAKLDVYKDTSDDVVRFENNGGELYYGGSSGHGTGANNLVLKTTGSNTIQMYGATGGVGLEIRQLNGRGGIPFSNSITSRGVLSMGTITDAGVHLQTSMIDRLVINYTGDVGIGTNEPQAKLDVNGGVRIGNDTADCDEYKVGTMRYRYDGFYCSYVEMCMQSLPGTFGRKVIDSYGNGCL